MAQSSPQSASEQDTVTANHAELSSAILAVTPGVAAPVASTASRKMLRNEKRVRPDHCLNCGRRPLTTRFCPDCGQENTPHAISIGHLLGDVMEEFIKWDGRLFRSLALLLFFPGRLTQEYNSGRRVNYISPFKMYFVVSAIFVFLLSWNRPSDQIFKESPIINISTTDTKDNSKAKTSKSGNAAKGTSKKGKNAGDPKQSKDEGQEQALQFFGAYAFPPGYLLADSKPVSVGHYSEAYERWQTDAKNKEKHSPWRKMMTGNVCHAIDTPATYIGNLIQSIGKAMFFLLPFYALLLAIFFFRSRRYYVEHLILAINNHTMAFLIGSMADVFIRFVPVAGPPVGGFLIVSYWLYELISLKIVYQRGWIGTMFRQGLIWAAYIIALIFGFAITALLTLLMPS